MKQNIKFGEVYILKDSIDYSQGATVSKIVTKNKCGSTTLFSFDKRQNLSEQLSALKSRTTHSRNRCVQPEKNE